MNGTVLLILVTVGSVLFWAVELAVNPRAACRACGGSGHHWLSRDKAWGDCKACGGSGKRLRFGARWVRPKLRSKK